MRETIKKHKSLEKIKQQRPDEFSRFCSDDSVSRYLRARNWNVKKAVKMLETSLIWRMNYKPEEIRWVSFYKKIADQMPLSRASMCPIYFIFFGETKNWHFLIVHSQSHNHFNI